MRQLLFALLTIMMFIISCKRNEVGDGYIIKNGAYTGTFQRQVSGSGLISNVTITFNSGNWTGQSQYTKYPALCHGTYQIRETDQITFENACPWTAEFDWSFILSGNYKIAVKSDSIEISKDYNGAFKDIYKLRKQ